MKQRLTYQEQIAKEIRKARQTKNPAAFVYYTQAMNYHACVSYESFIKSAAGIEWLKNNENAIALARATGYN